MKRYTAFDPPEYVSWTLDAAELDRFRAALKAHADRTTIIAGLTEEVLLGLYAGLLRVRLQDIALKRWVRQGVLSKAWLGTGEEATTVGPVHALDRTRDVVAPMIRNNGACAEMGMPLVDGFRAYLGTAASPSGGRDLHVGDLGKNVLQPISHVGDVVPVTIGIALSFKLRAETRVALTWIGDGSTKTGTAHEGLNFAAVQRVPAILIIQNNQVALGTPLQQHHAAGTFEHWPTSYGMRGGAFDGNNVLDAYAATRVAADACRAGDGPVLLIAETFRMGGHATHDEREARETLPADLFATWGKRDPIGLYEAYLVEEGIASSTLEDIEADITQEIDDVAREALAGRDDMPIGESASEGVYADS